MKKNKILINFYTLEKRPGFADKKKRSFFLQNQVK